MLLCRGNGADSSIYRPNGDDKRFRHRQDALVRCVAVTLFSAAGAASPDNNHCCELILLYDGDNSCMRMSLSSKRGGQVQDFTQQPTPLETEIVSAWKSATNEANRLRQHKNAYSGSGDNISASNPYQLFTKCILDQSLQNQTTATNKSKNKLPSHMPASKRDSISMLQSMCSIEFLRSHHLNVPLAVAMKKLNMKKLQAVWDDAKKHDSATSHDSNSKIIDAKIEQKFHSLLSEARGKDTTNTTNVLAAYLHESCDSELPCWSNALHDRNSEVRHIFLFCGTVRDMTDSENSSLSKVCNQLKIPLLPCRLGPVAEFTSKIVSVAGFHFYKGLLGSGLIKLLEQKQNEHKSIKPQPLSNNIPHKRLLHTIAMVPIDSTSLTSDPNRRCRVHWCMVRLCVCSLYRSKFKSVTREALENKLSFIFHDGVAINLNQRDFISSLAEKHQAAPSERQILEELCRRRDNVIAQERCDDHITQLISSYTRKINGGGDVYALDFRDELQEMPNQVVDLAYTPTEHYSPYDSCDSTLLAILHVRDTQRKATPKVDSIHKILLDVIQRSYIRMKEQSLLARETQDSEALTIIMLQHLDYQSKLFGLLHHVFKTTLPEATTSHTGSKKESSRKRQKKQKDGKKKKTKKKHNRTSKA